MTAFSGRPAVFQGGPEHPGSTGAPDQLVTELEEFDPKDDPNIAAAKSEYDDELDNLMEESIGLVAEARKQKAMRRSLTQRDPHRTEAQSIAMRAKLLEWELENEFVGEAAVVAVREERCECCGEVSLSTMGLYMRQKSKGKRGQRRWVLWSPQTLNGAIAKLPREYQLVAATVPVCPQCLVAQGFNAEAAVAMEWAKEPATVPGPAIGTMPPKVVNVPLPDNLESQPLGEPVLAPPKRQPTAMEQAFLDAYYGMSVKERSEYQPIDPKVEEIIVNTTLGFPPAEGME